MPNATQKLLIEATRRTAFQDAAKLAAKSLFKEQRAVYRSTAKRIVLKPGRRSGKTRTILPIALRAAAKFPGSLIPVLERTLTCNAAKAFWNNLQAFNDEHDLGISFRHTVKEATLPNGSRIQIYGVDTLELADKLRGESFPVAIVDECGTFRSHVLSYLVSEALAPGLMDYDGQIYLVGTPSHKMEGYWYDRCHDVEWEQHHWTILNNVEYGKMAYQKSREWREEALAEEILANGYLPREEWADKPHADIIEACGHPKFLREYLGVWIEMAEEAMYEFHPERGTIDRLPPTDSAHPWRFGLGIDLGYNDPTAFTITAVREGDPYIYVVESHEQREMIPSTIAAQIDRYKMAYGHFHHIVADTGGSGKLAVEEMNRKYGCNIIPAQKTGKRDYVEHMNGDFRVGKIQIIRSTNQDLIGDLKALPWNEDKTDAHNDFDDHLPDSLLYNYREWNTSRAGWSFEEPEPGSEKWQVMMEELDEARGDAFQHEIERIERDVDEIFAADLDEWD